MQPQIHQLADPAYKGLLKPYSQGQLPHKYSDITTRYSKSWGYFDPVKKTYFVGTFYPSVITPDPSDIFHTISAGEESRPDVISYMYYQTPELYWVILWVNGINDPFEQLNPGAILRIPLRTRLMSLGVL